MADALFFIGMFVVVALFLLCVYFGEDIRFLIRAKATEILSRTRQRSENSPDA